MSWDKTFCACSQEGYLEGLQDGFELGFKRGHKAGYVEAYVHATLDLPPPAALQIEIDSHVFAARAAMLGERLRRELDQIMSGE